MKRLLAILIAINISSSGLYGRSIQSLKTKGSIPSVGRYQKRLNLSGKGISSLEGLGEVRNIERASIVRLDNNDISTLPEGVLAPVEDTVQVLNLSNNKITTEDLRGLIGLKNLRALILNSNNVEEIPQEVLDGLPKLTFISLYDNPISIEKINQLRHKGYYISTLPITRANLKKAGLAAAALAGLILSAIGTVKFVKSKITPPTKEEIEEGINEAKQALLNQKNAMAAFQEQPSYTALRTMILAAIKVNRAVKRAESLALGRSSEPRELTEEEINEKIKEYEKTYVGMTFEDAKTLSPRTLRDEERNQLARQKMAQAHKQAIRVGVEAQKKKQKELDEILNLLPFRRRLKEKSKRQQERELEELFELKKYKQGPTGEYIETDEPLVTRVEEIDTDTE